MDAVEELKKELNKSKLSIAVWLNGQLVYENISYICPTHAYAAINEIADKVSIIEENYK